MSEDKYINKIYGRLKLIKKDIVKSKEKKRAYYWCECACGSQLKSIDLGSIKYGGIDSCGCLSTIKRNKNKPPKKILNTYDLTGEFGILYDNKGRMGYFDLKYYELIKIYNWYMDRHGYFCTGINHSGKIMLHRFITNCPEGMQVDHINGKESRYDNRECNLRICTHAQNQWNKKCKGVYYHKASNKWEARISKNNIRHHLGSFDTEEEAIEARRKAEKEYHGEFAPKRN